MTGRKAFENLIVFSNITGGICYTKGKRGGSPKNPSPPNKHPVMSGAFSFLD
jgi:hypothetical protein